MNNRALRSTLATSLFIHCITFLSGIINVAIAFLLGHLGILTLERLWLTPVIPIWGSVLLGTLLTFTIGQNIVRFVNNVHSALHQISRGNYEIELTDKPPVLELREIIQSFNSMTRELAGTEIMRNDFVENVSHEFKTPLTAIEGYATLLQQKNLPEEKRVEYTQKILQSTRRLNKLTGNILLLSRLEHQELEIPKETYSLDEQLREVILSLEADWTGKQIELDIQLEDCTCTANPALLSQVWQNILANAIKFSPVGGVIRIQLVNSDRQIMVSISDNGPGIPKEIQQRIFEKFYQADKTRSTQGNGLGLPLAKRIVNLHNGQIEVLSNPGSGMTFTIIMPCQSQNVP